MRTSAVTTATLVGLLLLAGCGRSWTDLTDRPLPADAVADAMSGELHLLTLNTWLIAPFSVDRTHRRDALIRRLRDGAPYDLVALQEVWKRGDRRLIADQVCERYGSKESASGLVLLWSSSRFKPLDGQSFFYESEAGEDALSSKGALLVRLEDKMSGEQLDVVVTHLQANAGFTSAEKWKKAQWGQLVELQREIIAWADPDNPRLVLGDFNVHRAWPGVPLPCCPDQRNDGYQELVRHLSITTDVAAVDLYGALHESASGHAALDREAWTTYDPNVNPLANDCEAHYDYVFSHNPERPLVATHGTIRRFTCRQQPLSDHFGVELIVRPETRAGQ